MLDQRLESQLRSALHEEGDGIAFTITAAELERRLVLRRRSRLSPMASLGLAAALGLALVALAGVAGGWFEQRPQVVPPASGTPTPSTAPSAADRTDGTVGTALPTVDQLILAGGGEDHLLVAQANGPFDGPVQDPNIVVLDPPDVVFGPLPANADVRITFACLGPTSAGIGLQPGHAAYTWQGIDTANRPRTEIRCDGTIGTQTAHVDAASDLRLSLGARASWRIAVHRIDGPSVPAPSAEPEPPLLSGPGEEQLFQAHSQPLDPASEGLPVLFAAPVTRELSSVRFSCTGAPTARYLFGDENAGVKTFGTTTVVPCDGGIHQADLAIGELLNGQFYVQAAPETQWNALGTSAALPIGLANDQPGWTLSSGFGPNYNGRAEEQGLSLVANQNSASGPILVRIQCAGTGTITGFVDHGLREGEETTPFEAPCTEDGATTADTYQVDGANVQIQFTAPPRSYVSVGAHEPTP